MDYMALIGGPLRPCPVPRCGPPAFSCVIYVNDPRAGPLQAVVSAQASAAMMSVNFIQAVGFNNGTAKTVDFMYDVVNGTTGVTQKKSISIPFLTIVPIPFLRVRAPIPPRCERCCVCALRECFRLVFLRVDMPVKLYEREWAPIAW